MKAKLTTDLVYRAMSNGITTIGELAKYLKGLR